MDETATTPFFGTGLRDALARRGTLDVPRPQLLLVPMLQDESEGEPPREPVLAAAAAVA